MNKEELLKILDGYKWIKVKQPDYDGCDSTQEEFDMLDKHHIEETEFLINKCRELASELLNVKQQDEPETFIEIMMPPEDDIDDDGKYIGTDPNFLK